MKTKILGYLVILLLFCSPALSQDLSEFNELSLTTNKAGMLVLGSWAVLNITGGSIGYFNTNGNTKYFHQMNAFWNLVNLGIAIGGYYGMQNTTLSPDDWLGSMNQHITMEKAYLFNGALDIAYIMSGIYLRELSYRKEKYSHQLKGYGNSLMLQGGFLFTFDLVMYMIQRNHRLEVLNPILENISFSEHGISLVVPL